MSNNPEPLRLNLGGGHQPYIGYKTVDFMPSADVVHDLRDPLPFPDDSIDEIFASHVIEHFPLHQIQEILMDWRRVLAPGGLFWGLVPDGVKVAEGYLQSVAEQDWNKKRIWLANFHGGWTNDKFTGPGQVHYVLYDEDLLKEMLSRAHFYPVVTTPRTLGPENHAIIFACGKAEYVPMDIRMTGAYPMVPWRPDRFDQEPPVV